MKKSLFKKKVVKGRDKARSGLQPPSETQEESSEPLQPPTSDSRGRFTQKRSETTAGPGRTIFAPETEEDGPVIEDIYNIQQTIQEPQNGIQQSIQSIQSTQQSIPQINQSQSIPQYPSAQSFVPIASDPDIVSKRSLINQMASEYADGYGNPDEEMDKDVDLDAHDLDIVPEDYMAEDEPLDLTNSKAPFDEAKYSMDISDEEDEGVVVKQVVSLHQQYVDIQRRIEELKKSIAESRERHSVLGKEVEHLAEEKRNVISTLG